MIYALVRPGRRISSNMTKKCPGWKHFSGIMPAGVLPEIRIRWGFKFVSDDNHAGG
jgi:hypothetical protein